MARKKIRLLRGTYEVKHLNCPSCNEENVTTRVEMSEDENRLILAKCYSCGMTTMNYNLEELDYILRWSLIHIRGEGE